VVNAFYFITVYYINIATNCLQKETVNSSTVRRNSNRDVDLIFVDIRKTGYSSIRYFQSKQTNKKIKRHVSVPS
jgi:hypothetical protein